jgi:hypothetical protein
MFLSQGATSTHEEDLAQRGDDGEIKEGLGAKKKVPLHTT